MKQSCLLRKYGILVLLALATACTSVPNNAPVIERSTDVPVPTVKPVVVAPIVKEPEVRPSYIVKRGDTLLRIAFDHGQSYSDLVAWNNLRNPNDIKVDQVLWIGPPEGSSVAKATPISSTSGVEIRSLTPVNPSTNKSVPRGDKRQYSESNLAELQKLADSSPTTAPVVQKNESAPVKSVEKPIVVAPSAEVIDWIWPADAKLTATFDDQKNKGVDLSGKLGQDVVAVAAGKVIYEGGAMRGYGNMLIIKHANNYLSAYAHNKVNLVKEGQSVNKGQKIAEMGNSDSDVVKLHFEIRQAGKPIDPMKLLPAR
ncbi:peptidoglycan DD-metalloendopeptidase family protein [Undibacterium sp. Di24W]|uniref:peptidoglycan DD-metalloendopeptidase family protein n=1 Tax=Undibacterium sp. Di24W TaxID=3413033 RepID=UPI003BF1CC25